MQHKITSSRSKLNAEGIKTSATVSYIHGSQRLRNRTRTHQSHNGLKQIMLTTTQRLRQKNNCRQFGGNRNYTASQGWLRRWWLVCNNKHAITSLIKKNDVCLTCACLSGPSFTAKITLLKSIIELNQIPSALFVFWTSALHRKPCTQHCGMTSLTKTIIKFGDTKRD